MEINPIAVFHTRKKNPYEAARQSTADTSDEVGEIQFQTQQQFEQALQGIEGFSHLWIIYQFHHNTTWKPMVMPPRGSKTKVGVFATRSPYRPNSLGLSCVEIVEVKGLTISVRNFDLLNETPIFDVKPYLPYADSFPTAKLGWLENIESEKWQVSISLEAQKQIQFLESLGVRELANFIQIQLQFDPLNSQKKRVTTHSESEAVLAYRTWRVYFQMTEDRSLSVEKLKSGYSEAELENREDPFSDKEIHRKFLAHF